MPVDEAVKYLKEFVVKTYGRKGEEIIKLNHEAINRGIESLIKVDIPDYWRDAEEVEEEIKDEPEFIKKIQRPIARHQGDKLPTSAFIGMEDGTFPMGTSAYEKRGIALMIPQWQTDNCIQCNQCSYVCPHSVIRPFLLDEEEKKNTPYSFETKKAVGKGLEGYEFRIQVSPLDCTGCGNCADVCPAPKKA